MAKALNAGKTSIIDDTRTRALKTRIAELEKKEATARSLAHAADWKLQKVQKRYEKAQKIANVLNREADHLYAAFERLDDKADWIENKLINLSTELFDLENPESVRPTKNKGKKKAYIVFFKKSKKKSKGSKKSR